MNSSGNINFDRLANKVEQDRVNKMLSFDTDNGYKENQGALTFLTQLETVISNINKELGHMSDEADGNYKKMSEFYRELTSIQSKLEKGQDPKKNAELIKNLDKVIGKMSTVAGKDVMKAADKLYESSQALIDAGLSYKEIMRKSAEDFQTAFTNATSQMRRDLVQIWQAVNVEKILTGGTSVSDMRNAQKDVKLSLGFNNSEFMSFQSTLFDQTMQINDMLGSNVASMSDVSGYLKTIKDLNLRNGDWAAKQYKAITLSNKYLGLSNSTMSKILGTATAMNDSNYAARQASILAALSADGTSAENIEDIASWWNDNAFSAAARFNNSDVVGAQTQAILSSSRGNLGAGSGAFEQVLSDFFTGDYVTFMDKYSSLVSADGSGELNRMIRDAYATGNVDVEALSHMLLEAIQTRYNQAGSMGNTYFGQLGLDTNLYNTGYAYTKNENEILKSIDGNIKALDTSMAENIKDLDTTTWWEKITNSINNMVVGQSNFFGLDWTGLLGLTQFFTAGAGAMAVASSIAQLVVQKRILNQIRADAIAKGLNGDDFSLWGSVKKTGGSILGGLKAGGITAGGLSTATAITAGIAGTAGGIYMGVQDYKKNGWKGAFTGNADFKDKSFKENAGDVLGNTAKYAALGAGIGSFIPGVGTLVGAGVGALAGLATGLIGGAVGNKETEENTEQTAVGIDSLIGSTEQDVAWNRRAALALESIRSDQIHQNGLGGTGGFGGQGDYLASRDKGHGYPWTVGSGYGKREVYENGKKTNKWGWHNGFDLWKYSGAPLGANVSGVVDKIWKSNGSKVGYGNGIRILGDDGRYYEYGHMLNPTQLAVGDRVNAGDTVGHMGSTGNSTGTHLHFTVRNSAQDDIYPADYIYNGLFSASGDYYKRSANSESSADPSSSALQTYLRKDQNVEASSGSGGMGSDYAKTSDIDRLIETLQVMNTSKTEKQDFMRALAGKNAMGR